MRLRVLHETVYHYTPVVQNAQHVAHLRPRTGLVQQVLAHSLQVDPAPTQCETIDDVFGNARTFFNLPFTHDQLRVRAETLLETSPPPPMGLPGEAWELVRERLCYRRGLPYQPAAAFSFASPYIPRHAAFVEYARESFVPGRPVLEVAGDLMSRIHRDFAYVAHATDAGTPALESLRLRRGVCQDFAHVMIGCLRSMGLAARYVSGYLLTQPPPGQPRLVGADASHAWVSVWSPSTEPGDAAAGVSGEDWFDLDPTNDRAAGEDYVTLAIGRDYSDVAPLRGVIHGGDHHVLHVAVTVEPAASHASATDEENADAPRVTPPMPVMPAMPLKAPENPG